MIAMRYSSSPVVRVTGGMADTVRYEITGITFTAFTGASGVTIVALGALLYPALRAGREPDLLTPPAQYGDFAVWQRDWLQGEVLESELEHWRQRLEGVPRALELTQDTDSSAAIGTVLLDRMSGLMVLF